MQGEEAAMRFKPVWTGLRFSVTFVGRRRAALGLDRPQRNDWTAPIHRWRGSRTSKPPA